MKLIKEITESVNYLTEEKDGKKTLFIEGPFLVSEKTNKNGRMYKEETMRKEVSRYTEEYINKNRAFGELGHPDTPSINLDRVSHLIVGLRQEGNDWIGKAKILETPMGNIAKNLIEGGAQFGAGQQLVRSDGHELFVGDHNSPPSLLGPNVGVPGAGQFVHGLAPLQSGVLVEAGVGLAGGGQVVEELGLFVVVQVVLTNVLI